MNVELHEADKHADFPHEFIRSANGSEFVICIFCSHWILRPMPDCACPASCHGMSAIRPQNLVPKRSA